MLHVQSRKITHAGVLELFDADRDTGTTPYQQQGDPTMYTDEALAARKKLSQNKGVISAIDKVRHTVGVVARSCLPLAFHRCGSD